MKLFLILSVSLSLVAACGSDKETSYYSMDKKYWDVQDYKLAVSKLGMDNNNEKELPNLDDPKTSAIFKKITDTTNISVVANDEQLGIAHRSDFTDELFEQYRDLTGVYATTDRTDKYKYPKEYAEVLKFGLCLQLYYIQLNNAKILKEADNPQDPEIINLTTSNQNVLIGNFNLYLDKVNNEDQFSPEALLSYAAGISYYFPRLLNVAPQGNYSSMIEKVDNMIKKTHNDQVKNALESLNTLLQPKKV